MSLKIVKNFLLLSQHPEKGRFIIDEIKLQYGIIGALFMQMSLDGMIDIVDDQLLLKAGKGSRNPIFSVMEEEIRKSKKTRKMNYWVSKLSKHSRRFKKIILNMLVEDRIIRIERRKFLGLIPWQQTFLVNQKARRDLIRQLKMDLLSANEISSDHLVLLALIETCKMQNIFTHDKEELKKIRKKLKEITVINPIARSVNRNIKQVQAAIFTTVIASSVVNSGGSH